MIASTIALAVPIAARPSRLTGLRVRIARIIAASTIALVVVGLTVGPATAASWTQPSMTCGTPGLGSITLEMPVSAPGRWSLFYYSIDGSAWQTTAWHYSEYGKFYQWNGRQLERIWPNGYGPTLLFLGNHRVYAYEYDGSYFTWLGYCDTSSIQPGDGFLFTP